MPTYACDNNNKVKTMAQIYVYDTYICYGGVY